MLAKRLGIHYCKYNLILDKKEQNKELGDFCRFVPCFIHNIWDNPKSLYIILSKLNKNESKNIAKFVTHNLYDKLFSSNNNEEQLIYIIYLLLKDEINSLKNGEIDEKNFLFDSPCGFIFEELILKKEVQYFFKETLVEIIKKVEMSTSNPVFFKIENITKRLEKYDNTITNASDKELLKENKDKINKKINIFNKNYLNNIGVKELKEKLTTYKNKEMIDYLENKLADIQKTADIYSTDKLISSIYKNKNSEKIFLYYIDSFIESIDIINMIFKNISDNCKSIPYSIKCICKIISFLIEKKYPKTSKVEQNVFLAKFFFKNIIFPLLNDPSYLLLIKECLISSKTTEKIRQFEIILTQFISGKFFTQENLIPFNNYFIEKMPDLFELLRNISEVKLPGFIDKLLNNKLPENYKYDYFKENQNENIFYRNICFNLNDLFILASNCVKLKNELSFDKAGLDVISRFESNFQKLKEITTNKSEEKEIKYFLLSDFINKEKYEKFLNLKREKIYLTLKEFTKIENEEQNSNNNIIKIKNFFFALLYHYPILIKNNFSEDRITNLTSLLRELKNNLYFNSSIYTAKQHIPFKWYIDSLIQYLPRISYNLKENDYEVLLKEIEEELKNSMKEYNYSELTELFEYINEIKKEKYYYEQTKNAILDIDLNKIVNSIIEREEIPVELIYNEKELTIASIENKTKNIKFPFLFSNKKKNENIICKKIKSLINKFPNIKNDLLNQKGNDIFQFIKFLKIPETLENYSKIIKEYLKTKDKKEIIQNIDVISNKIYDYILENLNSKLFPNESSDLDIIIYEKCKNIIWIDPSNLLKSNKNYIFDTFLPDAISYFRNIDIEKSPRKKLIYIKEIFKCIYNLGTFNSDKVEGAEDEMPLLNYTFIKANPKNIYSNCKYIQLFLGDKENKEEGNFVTKILAICEKMAKFTFQDMINISESEYEYNCILAKDGVLY